MKNHNTLAIRFLLTVMIILAPSVSDVRAQNEDVFQQVGECDIEILGNWLDVDDHLAYVSTLNGLAVIDIDDPRNPEYVGGLEFGSAWEIDVEGEYACMLSDGIVIVDISQQGHYQVEGRYNTSSSYTDIKVRNQLMFLTALKKGLEIVDVSNPGAPTAVSHFHEPGEYSEEWMGYMHLDIKGDYVYLGENEHGLKVIDVSSIGNPVKILTVPTTTFFTDVLVKNDLLFIGTSEALIVYDIAEPGTPIQIGILTDIERPAFLSAEGSLLILYHDDDPYRLVAVDISSPESLEIIGHYDTYSHDLFFDGRYVYSVGAQFRVFEINEPNDICCECADCDGNGTVNILDALWEANCILGIHAAGCSCDCNQDGTDNVLDILYVANIILNGSCPSDQEPTLADELQEALDLSCEINDCIGISAAVSIPGEEIWVGTSGVSHDDIPITPDMLFSIASVTKTFTAACILQLVEEGTLSLSDSLHQWLPTFPNVDSTITIRQLLNHTAGVFDYYHHPAFWDSLAIDLSRRWSPEETLTLVLEPYFPPGTDFRYSNTDYILLGMIIREATGHEVSAEFRTRFLDPLRLSHTFFDVEEVIPGEMAHGWADVDEDNVPDDLTPYPRTAYYSIEWTAGAMVSIPEDIVQWAQALYGGDVLSQVSLDEMLTFYPLSGEGRADDGYGLGVSRFKPEILHGENGIGHGGEVKGYRNVMVYLTDHGVSISVMINEMNPGSLWGTLESLIEVVMKHLER